MKVLGLHVTSEPNLPSQNRNLNTCKPVSYVEENVPKNISNYVFYEIKRNTVYKFNKAIIIKLEQEIN